MMSLISEYELSVGQLPVEPDFRQVMYVESHKNPELEKYIHDNYDKLLRLFQRYELEFICIPELTTRMSDKEFNEIASFYCPWLGKEDLDSLRDSISISLDDLFKEVKCKDDQPSVVNWYGRAYKLDVRNPKLFDVLFQQIASAYGSPSIRFSKIRYSSNYEPIPYKHGKFEEIPLKSEEDEMECSMVSEHELDYFPETDTAHDVELERLFNQAIKTIPGWIIKDALSKLLQTQEVVSTIVITPQARIFLPQYNNIEIKLMPKEKALYFLFLKHPEGIAFKDLPDYRKELARYYRRVSRSDEPKAIEAAIDKMIDVLSGDADTQRSRIKTAINSEFSRQFFIQYSRYYIIDGNRGQAMKINLPQDKIIWQLDI